MAVAYEHSFHTQPSTNIIVKKSHKLWDKMAAGVVTAPKIAAVL